MAAEKTQLNGFYLVLDGAQAGPYSEDELRSLRDAGRLAPETLVWKAGMSGWTRAAQTAAFQGFFLDQPPPIPAHLAAGSSDGAESSGADGASDDGEDDWFGEAHHSTAHKKAAKPQVQPQAERSSASKSKKAKKDGGAQAKAQPEDDPFAALMAAESQGAPQPAPDDVFAAVSGSDPGAPAFEVGEATRFFMIEAGMTQRQRNPPWKIALFIALFVGLPVGIVFALSQITVEQTYFDTETGTTETVEVSALDEVSESFSGLREKLLGVEKTDDQKEQEKVQRLRKARKKRKPSAIAKGPAVPKLEVPDGVAVAGAGTLDAHGRMGGDGAAASASIDFGKAQSDAERALAIYRSDDKVLSSGPVARRDIGAAPGLDGAPALSQEVMAKVIANNQKAFQACTEQELRRNPGFKGGKVHLTLTIGSSGMVTQASIDREEIDKAVIGNCLKMSARRILFPSFEGEPFSLEVPLVLTSGF